METVRVAASEDQPRCTELLRRAMAEMRSRRGGEMLGGSGSVVPSWGAVTVPQPPGTQSTSPPPHPTADANDKQAYDRGAETPVDGAEALVRRWACGTPERVLLLGEFDHAVVGMASGRVSAGNPSVGQIECCYVESEARGVGVGTALIEHLMAWFLDAGCSDVDALALPGDRNMKQLLEAGGFKTRLLVLHHRLG